MTTRFLIAALLFLAALPAQAASLVLQPSAPEAGVGEAIVVSVRFSAEGGAYNAVSGSVRIPAGVVVDRVDTAGSALALFPEAPRHVIADGAVAFTGGATAPIPDGALLFTIYAHAKNPGAYSFEGGEAFAYRANGEGTVVAASSVPSSVAVVQGAPGQRASERLAGAPLSVSYGQDPSVFDGKYFIAFYGGDTGKGVARYEVREGWWRPAVAAEGSYVLKDQSVRTTLWVSAVAPDGSTRTLLVLPPRLDYLTLASLLVVLLVLGLAGWFAYRRLRS